MDTGSQGILRGAGRRRRRGACDADNRPTNRGGTTLNYDDNGNLILEGTTSYSWNERNQLSATSLGAASYGYDAAGRRRSRTVSGISLQTLYDGWNAVQLKQAGAAVESRLFGLGLDEIYGRTNSGTSQSYLTDALGSVLSLRNPDQSAQADYTYGAYGETTETPPGASSNLIKYIGREQDTAGLYYYRNRYYSPVTDRFLSEDPIGLAGGENLYRYVDGNPLSYTDPEGLEPKNGRGFSTYYGNWCGRHWSGGQSGQNIPSNPDQPTDSLDACCMQHDSCYAELENSCTLSKKEKKKAFQACDAELARCSRSLSNNGEGWSLPPTRATDAYFYKQKLQSVFK